MPTSTTMSRSEREAFLAEVHIGVMSVAEPGRGPLTTPIWYGYEPGGELWIITGRGSRKMRLLEEAGRCSLLAQTERPPYRYVSVEGPVTAVEHADRERHTRPMAHRYLGESLGDRYVEATSAEEDAEESVLVRMRPERWRSVDYSKQFGEAP